MAWTCGRRDPESMKTKRILSIIGSTLLVLSPTNWGSLTVAAVEEDLAVAVATAVVAEVTSAVAVDSAVVE